MANRLFNVQALRLVAAGGVALSHGADLLVPHDAAHRLFWAVPWTAGVDLFFVISGFIMLLLTEGRFGSPRSASLFLRRRVARILPAYWFFTAIVVAAVIAAGGQLKGTTADGSQIATSLAFIPWPRGDGKLVPVLPQGWTLNYEMSFYLAYTLALLHRRGAVMLCACFALLAASNTLWPAELFALRFWTAPIILEFVAGIVLARLYLGGVRLPRLARWALAALAVAGWLLTGRLALGAWYRPVHLGIPAMLACAALILGPEPARLGLVRRSIRLGGDASYALYLSHYIVINMVALLWKRAGLGLPWLGVAVGLACSFAVAISFYLLVERRWTRWLLRILRADAPASDVAERRPMAQSRTAQAPTDARRAHGGRHSG